MSHHLKTLADKIQNGGSPNCVLVTWGASNCDTEDMWRTGICALGNQPLWHLSTENLPRPYPSETLKGAFSSYFSHTGKHLSLKLLTVVLGQQRPSGINKSTTSTITFMAKTIPIAIIAELWKENENLFNLFTSTQRHWKPRVIKKKKNQ